MNRKFNIFRITILLSIFSIIAPVFAQWGVNELGGIFWYEPTGVFAKDGWKLIDDDNDGVGYFYFFDKDGILVIDDITPDYKIVGLDGKRLNLDGEPESQKIERLVYDGDDTGVYSAEILEQIKAEQNITMEPKGITSSGMYLYAKDPTQTDGPSPADGLILETNAGGAAGYLLGPNVVLKKDKNEQYFDPLIDKKLQEHIKSGDKYSKKVNGTTFNKTKWKDVMALKGSGATITFVNPKNNFNKVKGRIATHYFSYSDRTTECTFTIYNEDDGEELYSTSDFNYNAGVSFECIFPKKASAIRFELEVSGQYTSRVCYLRNCEFGFDREAYQEELYEDEVEAEYIARYGADIEPQETEEENDDSLSGEYSIEGEDPGARYRRMNEVKDDYYWATFSYDEEDDSITPQMKASISEAKRRVEEAAEKRDQISGPAFDPNLKNETAAVGPGGSSVVSGVFDGEDD